MEPDKGIAPLNHKKKISDSFWLGALFIVQFFVEASCFAFFIGFTFGIHFLIGIAEEHMPSQLILIFLLQIFGISAACLSIFLIIMAMITRVAEHVKVPRWIVIWVAIIAIFAELISRYLIPTFFK